MKRFLPLTYEPKIQGVINGTIRQTIRKGWKLKIGDQVAFHGWEGTPYKSKWSFRTEYFTLNEVIDIRIDDEGFDVYSDIVVALQITKGEVTMDEIARLDGIDPPTGEELRSVLLSMGCIGDAQILRW